MTRTRTRTATSLPAPKARRNRTQALAVVAGLMSAVLAPTSLSAEEVVPPAPPPEPSAPPLTLESQAAPPTQQPPGSDPTAAPPTTTVAPAATAPAADLSAATASAATASGDAASAAPAWTKNLSVGGGTIIWYYQPLRSGGKNNIDVFFVNLLFDGHVGAWGLHIEPRFRDNKLRPHFGGTNGGTAWLQEAYASVKLPGGATLKVGKAYKHFGLFWDNSFYGNVQVYDGLKLDPNLGLSLEGTTPEDAVVGARYWAQFFVVDGQTNVALDGRETFTIPGARRRNQAVVRVEPFFRPSTNVTVKVGLSGEFLQADLPSPVGKQDVYRGAADITLSVGPWSLWSEFIRQNGQTVTDFPIAGTPATATTPAVPGQASKHTNYFLAGTELAIGKIAARYNVSYGGYRDVSISEWLHVPGIGVTVSPNVTFLGEFVYWKRFTTASDSVLDKSLNITLHAHF